MPPIVPTYVPKGAHETDLCIPVGGVSARKEAPWAIGMVLRDRIVILKGSTWGSPLWATSFSQL